MSENDERDPNNPLDRMMPPGDNPEYHRKLKEHRDAQHEAAETAVLSDPAHAALGDRLTPVRQAAPQVNPPQPLPPTAVPPVAPPQTPQEYTGLTVDPTQGEVQHTPVEPRLPEGAGGAPPIQPPAAPPAPAAAAPPPPPAPAPVLVTETLSQLRQDFGIEQIPLTDVTLNGHTFSMRVLDTASVSTAIRFADTLSMTERENAINLQIALVAMSVMTIDGEPLYKVFDVEITPDHLVMVEGVERVSFNPLTPPAAIRTTAATQFMEFLNTTASASLLTALWDKYNSDVDPKSTLDAVMGTVRDAPEEASGDEIPLR